MERKITMAEAISLLAQKKIIIQKYHSTATNPEGFSLSYRINSETNILEKSYDNFAPSSYKRDLSCRDLSLFDLESASLYVYERVSQGQQLDDHLFPISETMAIPTASEFLK